MVQPASSTFNLFETLKPVYELYKLVSLYPETNLNGARLDGSFVLQAIKDWKAENTESPTELSNLTLLEYVGTLFNMVVSGIAANSPKT